MKEINYKSDFDAIITLKDSKGTEVPWPDCDWEARFYAASKTNAYIAGRKGDEYTNCFAEADGRMHVVFNNHRLGRGVLKWELHVQLPNGIYPDDIQDLYRPQELGIELVAGAGDNPMTAEVEAVLPYIKGDKGDKGDAFTYEDFTPEEIATLQKPATDAAASVTALETHIEANETERKTAETEREAAEQGRVTAEQGREAAESTRLSAETLRVDAETARTNAEALRDTAEEARADAEETRVADENTRESNETARVAAETARATEFAGFENTISSKQDALTTTDDLNISANNELSLTDLAKKRLFIDMWNNAAGEYGTYNEDTGYFELNGLTDITYKQAMDIYRYTSPAFYGTGSDTNNLTWGSVRFRTNLPTNVYGLVLSGYYMYADNNLLEVVRLPQYYSDGVHITTNRGMFCMCRNLREIVNTIIAPQQSTHFMYDWYVAFDGCSALETIWIKYLYTDIKLAACKLLRTDCLKYMIENRTAKHDDNLTVTLHPEAYARVTEEILALAAEKNITIATT